MSENQVDATDSGITYPASIEAIASHLSIGVSTLKGWLTRFEVPHTKSDDLRGIRLFDRPAVAALERFKALRDQGIPVSTAAKMLEDQVVEARPAGASVDPAIANSSDQEPSSDEATDPQAIALPQSGVKELAAELTGALMPVLQQTQDMATQVGHLSFQLGEAKAIAALRSEEVDRLRASEEELKAKLAAESAARDDLARRLAEAEARARKKGWFSW